MRWEDFRRSTNIRDRRGAAAGGLGIGTVVVLGLLGWALGIDPRLLIGGAETISSRAPIERDASPTGPPRDNQGRFAAAILGNTEDVWKDVLPAQTGVAYKPPLMELFSGSTRTRCGAGAAAMGPFYCPLDQTIYLDLTFFREMEQKFRAGGEFAYAYVIAHEVGHHVEHLMGILGRVQARKGEVSQTEANQLSVRVELMADCLAGVWAYHSHQRWKSLEAGDVERAIKAAEAIGDDKLQKRQQGYVVPDSFTHGSSEQRVRWLTRGLKSGQVRDCDAFQSGSP